MKLKMKVKHYVHCLGFYTHHTHTKRLLHINMKINTQVYIFSFP